MTLTTDADRLTDELLGVAEHWCGEGTRLGAEYAQAFVEVTADIRLDCAVRDGAAVETGSVLARRSGVGLLLRYRDSWWFGSAPLAEPQALARQLALVCPTGPRVPPAIPRLRSVPGPPSPWPAVADAGLAGRWCAGAQPVRLDLIQDFFHRYRVVVDTRGVRAASPVSGGRQRCSATAVGADTVARSFTRRSRPDWGAETPVGELVESVDAIARDAVRRARGLLPARNLGHRRTPVVLAPKAGAALLHELIGHAVEADNFEKHTHLVSAMTDGPLCDAPLGLVDDAGVPGGIGSLGVDDDGQPGARTTLVQDGVLVGRLTNLLAAYPDAAGSTGNGRRQDYTRASLPRATNTVVLPGPDGVDRLCEVPPEGLLYVLALSSGETVPARGDFCFSAAEGYYLTPGGGRQPLRDVNLHGDARGTLRRLVGIADDVEGDNVTCGKQGQSVLIGLYSPTMRFDSTDWWC
ncbi:protease TldD [Micromonospora sp. MW-13]|uniref:TldD/PmbA family protein n=1 Tax=Micromonospora sp. MW-13 TaxID=2094022 RepID=UPI000EC6BA51|nr:TldD/PmbA family protein [Micromonospora sp. MW-13]RGC68155.1 protease TldD [Micromonospora sp. MW-13]